MRANPLFTAIAATAVAFGLVIGAAATAAPGESAAQGAIVRAVGSPDAAHARPAVAMLAGDETVRAR